MNTAATTVRTFSIASFRVDSQIARIEASPPRKRISRYAQYPFTVNASAADASHQRWRRRAAFDNAKDNLHYCPDADSGHGKTLHETCRSACAYRPPNSDKGESEDSSVFEEVSRIRQKGG